MATIQLSTGLKNELASKIWVTSSTAITPSWLAAHPPLAYNNNFGIGGSLYIMQGAVPSDFTTLTSVNARVADILVEFRSSNSDFASSSYANNVFTLNTSLVQATNTGTATWFWIIQTPNAQSTPNQQIAGTVGTIGSGADLEISSTSLVGGSSYRISNLVFNMPDSWTIS
jgi:hypothetical protein